MEPADILRKFINSDIEQFDSFKEGDATIMHVVKEALFALAEEHSPSIEELKNRAQAKLVSLESTTQGGSKVASTIQSTFSSEAAASSGTSSRGDMTSSLIEIFESGRNIFKNPTNLKYLPPESRKDAPLFSSLFEELIAQASSIPLYNVIPSGYVNSKFSARYGKEEEYPQKVKKIAIALTALFHLAKEKGVDLKSLFLISLIWSGQVRHNIAKEASAGLQLPYFGKLRYYDYDKLENNLKIREGHTLQTPMHTYCMEYVERIREKVQQLYDDLPKDALDKSPITIKSDNINFCFNIKEDNTYVCGINYYADISESEKIPLSCTLIYGNNPDSKNHHFWLTHPYPTDLPNVMIFVAKLFEEAVLIPSDDPELIPKIAKFQYYLQQACPFERGSTAISEWFEIALFALHGFEIVYKPGSSSTLAALLSSLSDFTSNYRSFFDLRPL